VMRRGVNRQWSDRKRRTFTD